MTGALAIKRLSRCKDVLLPRAWLGVGFNLTVLVLGLGLRTGSGFSGEKQLTWAWGRVKGRQRWDAPSVKSWPFQGGVGKMQRAAGACVVECRVSYFAFEAEYSTPHRYLGLI